MIMDGIFQLIEKAFGPVERTIDELHVSEEERLKAMTELQAAKNEAQLHFLKLEIAKLDTMEAAMNAQAKIIEAETKSESFITRAWRPIASLVLLTLIVLSHLGIIQTPVPPELWQLFGMFISIYAGSRGIEKLAGVVTSNLGNNSIVPPQEIEQ